MPFLRLVAALLIVAFVGAFALVVAASIRGAPADLPWHPLDLGTPPGLATSGQIARLADDPRACDATLARAGIAYRALPPRDPGGACALVDAIAWARDGSRLARYAPAAPPLACPLAVGLADWEWNVVQAAAARTFGTTVVQIDHYGSFACRRINGAGTGNWSEHAHANAIDIAGFLLADGRRISVAGDWRTLGPKSDFLHRVRDGGCRLFGTMLSPDYNAAHRSHFHIDGARRGGWSFCR